MAGIDVAVAAVAQDLGVVEEEGDVGMQGGLIALEGEQVVAALIDDLPGDLAMAAHRIDGDDRALERMHFQQLRDCGDLVRLAIDGQLAEHEALVGRPGGDQMQRRAAGGAVEGMAQGLAVDRRHASGAFGKALHETQEAAVELDRIEQAKHAREGVMARDAVTEPQKLPQKGLLRAPEQSHVRAVLAAAQHRAEGNHQDLMQIVAGVAVSRIFKVREAAFEWGPPAPNPMVRIHFSRQRKRYSRQIPNAIPLDLLPARLALRLIRVIQLLASHAHLGDVR